MAKELKRHRKQKRRLAIQRDRAVRVNAAIIATRAPPGGARISHNFADGVYCRTMEIQGGTTIVGVEHKLTSFVFLAKGSIRCLEGGICADYCAPAMLVNKPGQKNSWYAFEDSLLYHALPNATGGEDIAEILASVTDTPYSEIYGQPDNAQTLAYLDHVRADYLDFVAGSGLSESVIGNILADTSDLVAIDSPDFYMAKSDIEGYGLFCARDVPEGYFFGLARFDGKRSQLGRMVNHSPFPNCLYAGVDSLNIGCYALTAIMAGNELVVDYRQALDENKYWSNQCQL
jgi:hypothetical protein